jgi:hypothetical protein
MRIIREARPKNGDERQVRRFILFPLTINDGESRETRWLEMAWLKQVYNDTVWMWHGYWETVGFSEDSFVELKERLER